MEGGRDKPFPFDLGSAFANLSRYLTSSEKLTLASTCTLMRQVMMRGSIWQNFQICDINMTTHWGIYLKWVEKYLPIIQPIELSVTIVEDQHQKDDQQLIQILLKPKKYIESVSIRSHSQVLHLAIAKACPNTSKLVLHSPQINDKVVQLMLQYMCHLSHLQITADSLSFTFQNASNYLKNPLQKLILKPHNIYYEQLLKVVQNEEVNQLDELEIDVEQCDQQTLVGIVASLKHISRLRLYHFERFDQLGYADLLASILSPEMKELALTKCYHLDMTAIVHKMACPTIRALDLTEATRLTDSSVLQLAPNCHNLREINLSWCYQLTDISISEVIKHCPALERVTFNGVKALTDAAFEEYVTFKNIFRQKIYNSAKYEFRKECKRAKEAELPEIYSKYGTKTALKQLFQPCSDLYTRKNTLSNLRYMQCNSCNNITDMILKIIHCFSRTAQVINYYGEDVSLFRNSFQQQLID